MTTFENNLFTYDITKTDPEITAAINAELERQQNSIELIASENLTSQAVMTAQGSVLTNKYAEGYPRKRYYGGCDHVDQVEDLARDRLKKLFNCAWANVQPHSGSQANQAVYMALLQPGDTILGMGLDHGGHLTHGSPVNQSGKWFNAEHYGVNDDGYLDYEAVRARAHEVKPKLIISGATVYSRSIDFAKFREIADEVGAYLLADIAHISGLVAGGAHMSPIEHAHVTTTTTHKALRGPRGGVIMSNDLELGKKIDKAIFPGLQGGPLMHVIAAKAVCFGEALDPSFKVYAENVVKNAKALGESLVAEGIDLVTGGTDNHLLLIDLRRMNLTGKAADQALEEAALTCNKNTVPNDPQSPFVTSGVRIGSPAGTTRGFGEEEFKQIGLWIARVLHTMRDNPDNVAQVTQEVREEVRNLCAKFPIYPQALPA